MSWLPQSTSTEAGKLVCVVSVIEQGPNNEPASFSQTLFARYARVSGCVVMGDRMHLALLGALYTEEQLEKDAAAPEEEGDAYAPRPFSRVCLKQQLRRDRENIPRGFKLRYRGRRPCGGHDGGSHDLMGIDMRAEEEEEEEELCQWRRRRRCERPSKTTHVARTICASAYTKSCMTEECNDAALGGHDCKRVACEVGKSGSPFKQLSDEASVLRAATYLAQQCIVDGSAGEIDSFQQLPSVGTWLAAKPQVGDDRQNVKDRGQLMQEKHCLQGAGKVLDWSSGERDVAEDAVVKQRAPHDLALLLRAVRCWREFPDLVVDSESDLAEPAELPNAESSSDSSDDDDGGGAEKYLPCRCAATCTARRTPAKRTALLSLCTAWSRLTRRASLLNADASATPERPAGAKGAATLDVGAVADTPAGAAASTFPAGRKRGGGGGVDATPGIEADSPRERGGSDHHFEHVYEPVKSDFRSGRVQAIDKDLLLLTAADGDQVPAEVQSLVGTKFIPLETRGMALALCTLCLATRRIVEDFTQKAQEDGQRD